VLDRGKIIYRRSSGDDTEKERDCYRCKVNVWWFASRDVLDLSIDLQILEDKLGATWVQ
jgi:hypothetical protein